MGREEKECCGENGGKQGGKGMSAMGSEEREVLFFVLLDETIQSVSNKFLSTTQIFTKKIYGNFCFALDEIIPNRTFF